MSLRGIRGATTVVANTVDEILGSTRELLQTLQTENGFAPEDLAAIWFTVTDDLNATFPAQAARQLGWSNVPLLDALEIPVPDSLRLCIRVLVLWNCSVNQASIRHVYLRSARVLRPDIVKQQVKEESR